LYRKGERNRSDDTRKKGQTRKQTRYGVDWYQGIRLLSGLEGSFRV
jgi:hypothetical protein